MMVSDVAVYETRRYKRAGNCKRCGQCCLTVNCDHFEMGEVATCKIHDSPDKPSDCELFPEAPPIMIKGCGYYFLDIWENNRIVREREV